MQPHNETINKILAEADIEGFIDAGAPADEYTDEAAQISAAIALLNPEQLTPENLYATISLLWLKSFNLNAEDINLRLPALQNVTRRIIATLLG